MTELIGGNILIDKEEYEQLKLKANLGEMLLSHMLRNYPDDQWDSTTRDTMDECSKVFWGETIVWELDEEERKMKLDYTPHNMQPIEVKVVTRLFEMLKREGWVPKKVADGGDYVPTPTWSEALETIDSVEWSALFVADGVQTRWVALILGNGRDVVSDYSCSDPSFDALMKRHADWVETTLED